MKPGVGPIACRRVGSPGVAVLLTLAGLLGIEVAFSGDQPGLWAAAAFWTAAFLVAASAYPTRR